MGSSAPEFVENASPSPTTGKEAVIQISRKKDDFLLLHELGEGSYSTVYLASEKATNRKFAMKICFKQKILREKKVQQVFREKDILRLLSTPEHSNPFIVRLYCTFQDQDSLYFALTLADRKDLLYWLKTLGGKFNVEQSRFVLSELCAALAHIHSLQIVHRDVKPENILIRHNGHILLSDFGCAKCLDNQSQQTAVTNAESKPGQKLQRRCSFVGTAQYVSPEVLNGEETTAACDWWAFGVIMFELLAGRRPFAGDSEYLLYRQILKLAYTFPTDFPSDDARSLIQQLLVISPSERLGWADSLAIQQHPFFANVEWIQLSRQSSPIFPIEDEPGAEEDRGQSG